MEKGAISLSHSNTPSLQLCTAGMPFLLLDPLRQFQQTGGGVFAEIEANGFALIV